MDQFYEYYSIHSADECAKLAFDDVLPRAKTISAREFRAYREQWNRHGTRFKAPYFLRGGEKAIRRFVLQSLRNRYLDHPPAEWFAISRLKTDGLVEILSFDGEALRSLIVWRIRTSFFMAEREDEMQRLQEMLTQDDVNREAITFYSYQAAQLSMLDRRRVKLHCSSCGGNFDVGRCGEVKISGSGGKNYAIFRCPKC